MEYIQTDCGSRLPCGLCLITNKPCPFYCQFYYQQTTQSNYTTPNQTTKDYTITNENT